MRIKNWEKFQHYHKGRGAPPWVKLYRDLLNDKEWHKLDGDSAKFLVNLWILAAENNGELPDSDTLAFRLRLASNLIAKYLSACSHWIVSDASNLIARCYQLATPETETETETETESLMSSSQANIDGDCLQVQKITLANGKQKHLDAAIRVLDFLNLKTGRHYRHTKANLTLIAERLKEGATEDECRIVIVRQQNKWSGTDMVDYLRPATLFNRTKFAQYVGEVPND